MQNIVSCEHLVIVRFCLVFVLLYYIYCSNVINWTQEPTIIHFFHALPLSTDMEQNLRKKCKWIRQEILNNNLEILKLRKSYMKKREMENQTRPLYIKYNGKTCRRTITTPFNVVTNVLHTPFIINVQMVFLFSWPA